MALQRGAAVPQFAVTTVDGATFDYSSVWQRRNLLLIAVGSSPDDDLMRYAGEIAARAADLDAFDAVCVVAREVPAPFPAPGVIIADRWGEIYLAADGTSVADLPRTAAIFECLRFVDHECPECQGEAR